MNAEMKMKNILKQTITITVILIFLLPSSDIIVNITNAKDDNKSESISPSYDNNGNLLNDGTNLYTYDVNNNLIKITNQNTGEETTFTYGPLGNRVTTIQNSVTTHHLYNGVDEIQERASDGSLLREYIPGFAIIDYTDVGSYPAGEAEVLYHLLDVLGSTVALTDNNGDIVEQYYYEPYGDTVITNGEGAEKLSESAFGNPYMWTGQRYDSENELYHFYARSYSPYLGRFIQRDPLGYVDGMNLYEYGKSSPLVFVDPLGLDSRVNTLMVPSWEFLENLIKWGGRTPEEASDEVIDLTYASAILTLDWGSMIIPGIADARDVGEVVSLHDFSTGERLDSFQWRITVLAGLFPLIPARGARKGFALLDDIGTYHHHSGGMSGGGGISPQRAAELKRIAAENIAGYGTKKTSPRFIMPRGRDIPVRNSVESLSDVMEDQFRAVGRIEARGTVTNFQARVEAVARTAGHDEGSHLLSLDFAASLTFESLDTKTLGAVLTEGFGEARRRFDIFRIRRPTEKFVAAGKTGVPFRLDLAEIKMNNPPLFDKTRNMLEKMGFMPSNPEIDYLYWVEIPLP